MAPPDVEATAPSPAAPRWEIRPFPRGIPIHPAQENAVQAILEAGFPGVRPRSGLSPRTARTVDALVLDGLNGQSIARRLTAAAQAAGITGRITGHSTARGASTTETMLAGGWQTARMVAHYSAGAAAELGAIAKYL